MAKQKITFESTFDTYTVFKKIGDGGSGSVYEVNSSDGGVYAVKCLPPDRITSEKKKRFHNELAFCEKVQHRNIIKVIDHGFIEQKGIKCPFYVMPLYQQTLRGLLKQGVRTHEVLPLFAQMLDAVEAAHLLNIWHRDLKPENILVNNAGNELVVADWGIAHFEEEHLVTIYQTVPQAKLGNYAYAAPEQRVVGGTVNHKADIYALGVMLNELFTGNILQGAGYRSIGEVSAENSYLDSIVEKMVQQRAEVRYENVSEIKNVLISRGNEFIVSQALDKLKKTVVPSIDAHDSYIDDPPCLINRDYRGGHLVLTLSRWPDKEWQACFSDQGGNFNYIQGKEPRQWAFMSDRTIRIDAEERQVQALINHFKEYVDNANRLYKAKREKEARREEAARRAELKQATEAEEARLRVLRNTSI